MFEPELFDENPIPEFPQNWNIYIYSGKTIITYTLGLPVVAFTQVLQKEYL